MKPRPRYPGIAGFLAVVLGLMAPAEGRAERPEPVSERPDRGRVAVTVTGPEIARPGMYYVSQGASLNDLVARAGGLKNAPFVFSLVIQRERKGNTIRLRVPSKGWDQRFNFQERDQVICRQAYLPF